MEYARTPELVHRPDEATVVQLPELGDNQLNQMVVRASALIDEAYHLHKGNEGTVATRVVATERKIKEALALVPEDFDLAALARPERHGWDNFLNLRSRSNERRSAFSALLEDDSLTGFRGEMVFEDQLWNAWNTYAEQTRTDTRDGRRKRQYDARTGPAETIGKERREGVDRGPAGLGSPKRITKFVDMAKGWHGRDCTEDEMLTAWVACINEIGEDVYTEQKVGQRWPLVKYETKDLGKGYGKQKGSTLEVGKHWLGKYFDKDPDKRDVGILLELAKTLYHETRHREQELGRFVKQNAYGYQGFTDMFPKAPHQADVEDRPIYKGVSESDAMDAAELKLKGLKTLPLPRTDAQLATKDGEGAAKDKIAEFIREVPEEDDDTAKETAANGLERTIVARGPSWTTYLNEWEELYMQYRERNDEWDAHLVGDLVEDTWKEG